MAVIFTYPLKSTLVSGDLFLISDSEDENKTKNTSITSIKDAINVVDSLNALTGAVTLTGGTNITLNTSGNNIVINDDGIGVGTVNKLTKWSATTGRLTDSIITEDTGGPGIQVGGNVAVKSGSYIFTPSILDGAGEFGSANQVLSKSADNSFIEWATAGGGDTYTLQAGTKSGTSVPLKLDAATGTDSTVNLKEGANITLLQNSATEIEITAAGDTTYTASTGLTLTGTVFSANTVGAQSNIANNASSVAGRSYPTQTGAASGTVGSDHLVVNIPWTDTTYTAATNSTLGLVKLGFTQAAKLYPVELSSEQAYVNVPWTDTDTTYEAGTGLTLTTGAVFNANTVGTQSNLANVASSVSGRSYPVQTGAASGTTGTNHLIVNVPGVSSLTTTGTGASTLTSGVLNIPISATTASQGLTKTSNNITLDIADPTTGWAILGGGPGTQTQIIGGFAGTNATGNKNFGISNFISSNTVTSADQNVAVGFNSMGTTVSTASRNVVVGFEAGESMTTSNDSVLIGQDAGEAITTGGENTIIGSNAGETITTGSRNTIIGTNANAVDGTISVSAVAIGRSSQAATKSVAVGSGSSASQATSTAIGNDTSVTAANGIAIGQGCAVSSPVLGLASALNPIQTPTLTEPNIEEYLTVVVNGVTRYIALYSGTP